MNKDAINKRELATLSHFRYQLRRFLRFSEEVTRQHGVTHLQYLLLLHIKGYYRNREWATIGELAELLQSHHHGAVSLVSRCEKLGLVFRKKSAVDRREVEVHLTPAGEKMVDELARQHRDELMNLQGIFQVPGARELGGSEGQG
ncbi:MAG: MarR family transcriptional regulator [Sulfuricella sp.]|nr:MarR family transcriptional regulator [Sulfuricella sp.]